MKPTVLVGVSPVGIWRSGTPEGVTGLDAYGEIYADSRRWLADGWVDYLAPQLYWAVDGEQDRFRQLDAWWQSQNSHGRHIWPGLAAAKVGYQSTGWSPAEMTNEIRALRDSRANKPDDQGHVLFRFGALLANDAALAASLQQDAYPELALVPASPWLGRDVPAPPRVSSV